MEFEIGHKKIGGDNSCFIIAELSANHLQKYDLAEKTILEMSKCGVDAIKMQTFRADTITIPCENEYFKIKGGTLWDGGNLYKLYEEAYMPWEWQEKLKNMVEELGLAWFSSVNDTTAVDFLESIGCAAYKLPSFEITDTELIEYIAKRQKPFILSTGIATLAEIEEALNICKGVNNDQIALLKCTSAYPCPPEEMNLNAIPSMASIFDTVIGLSDHTLGAVVPIAAVALGAKIVEKHFILDRSIGGPDSEFSLEPHEFKAMVNGIREAERALGDGKYVVTPKMQKGRQFAKSLFVVKDIKEGEVLSKDNIRSIRPGDGLAPKFLKEILGKKAKQDIAYGTPLSWDLLI